MENWEFVSDPDYASIAKEEQAAILKELAPVKLELFRQIYDLLLPAASNSVILEVMRAKDQPLHSEWNEELVRMYLTAAPRLGWSAELISEDVDETGIRRAMIRVSGERSYQFLKFERGVHREIISGDAYGTRANRNRTHTRYAEVFVYEEPELTVSEIKPSEIDIETMRASGAGGQHVNRTDSAVRVRHRPTGLEVSIQSHRSQHQNKTDALRILAAKVLEKRRQEDFDRFSAKRNEAAELTDENRYVRTYDWRYDQVALQNLLTHGNLEPQLEARLMQVLKSRLAKARP
jgi:peptide chain release factor 1